MTEESDRKEGERGETDLVPKVKLCCFFGSKPARRLSILRTRRGVRRAFAVPPLSAACVSLLSLNEPNFPQTRRPCCCLLRLNRVVSDHDRASRTSSWVKGWGYNGCVCGRDCCLEKMKESLYRYCFWSGGRCRLPMCLIRRWGETMGRTYLGIAVEVMRKGGVTHAGERRNTRVLGTAGGT
jgi:hypothetical protein